MQPTDEKKIAFLAKAYFAVTDNPSDDVNPYTDLPTFLTATVGTLRWGITADVRKRSKYRFADNFVRVLAIYHVTLGFNDAMTGVADDAKTNQAVVDAWAKQAKFPDV